MDTLRAGRRPLTLPDIVGGRSKGQRQRAVCFVWRDLRPYLCETRSVVTDCGARSVCMWGFMGRVGKKSTRRSRAGEVGERAAATQNMDRAFTWPCALWVRQVAASSTGPPTWASCCCYCRRRHWSVCCRWEACRRTHAHTQHTHAHTAQTAHTHRRTGVRLLHSDWPRPRTAGECR